MSAPGDRGYSEARRMIDACDRWNLLYSLQGAKVLAAVWLQSPLSHRAVLVHRSSPDELSMLADTTLKKQ